MLSLYTCQQKALRISFLVVHRNNSEIIFGRKSVVRVNQASCFPVGGSTCNSGNRWRVSERGRRYSGADLMSNGNAIANKFGHFAFRGDACLFTTSKDISVCGDSVLRCSVSENSAGRSECSNGDRS